MTQTKDISVDSMALAYSLSQAEIAISRLVIEGKTNSQIAEFRNVSTETVKSPVKVLLKKTQCSRRSDLIRLAYKTTPPIK